MHNHQQTLNLQNWFLNHACGKLMLQDEQKFIDNIVQYTFGYNALQINFNNINYLNASKIHNQYYLSINILADITHLPFVDNSIDLIVAPHSFDLYTNHKIILQEFYRILAPNGKLIISGFNYYSLLNVFITINSIIAKLSFQINFNKNKPLKSTLLAQQSQDITPKFNSIKLNAMTTSIKEANLQIVSGGFLNYLLPINCDKILTHIAFLNKLGNRWLPNLSNIYVIVANKELLMSNVINNNINSNFIIKPSYV